MDGKSTPATGEKKLKTKLKMVISIWMPGPNGRKYTSPREVIWSGGWPI